MLTCVVKPEPQPPLGIDSQHRWPDLAELRVGAEDERAVDGPESLLEARNDLGAVEHLE